MDHAIVITAVVASWSLLYCLQSAVHTQSCCRFHKSVFKMERGLPPNKLAPKLRAAVDEYRVLLPVVAALRNKALKERHWAKVFAAIGSTLNRDETFTLQVWCYARDLLLRACACTRSLASW